MVMVWQGWATVEVGVHLAQISSWLAQVVVVEVVHLNHARLIQVVEVGAVYLNQIFELSIQVVGVEVVHLKPESKEPFLVVEAEEVH